MAFEMFSQHGMKFYTLYSKDVTLKSGYVSKIYFFVRSEQPVQSDWVACDLPADREVVETRTGMLVLRKKVA